MFQTTHSPGGAFWKSSLAALGATQPNYPEDPDDDDQQEQPSQPDRDDIPKPMTIAPLSQY